MEVVHVQGVKSPWLGDIDHARVLLPEDFVVPQPNHPDSNEDQRYDERVEEEKPIAVQDESFAFLVHHQSHHGEESENVEDEDLPLCHEIPAKQKEPSVLFVGSWALQPGELSCAAAVSSPKIHIFHE